MLEEYIVNYKVEALPDVPVVLLSMFEQYSFATDDLEADKEIIACLDESDEPLFFIVDTTRRPLSLDDVVHAANKDARGEDPLFHHPQMQGLIVVSPSDMVRLAAKGLTTVTFGNVNAKAFKFLDEALDYVRAQMTT